MESTEKNNFHLLLTAVLVDEKIKCKYKKKSQFKELGFLILNKIIFSTFSITCYGNVGKYNSAISSFAIGNGTCYSKSILFFPLLLNVSIS